MYNWIQTYLSNRRQFTVINGISSESKTISYGVPQGSVLGPLLFLIYINDISNAVPDGELRLFADDTSLFVAGPDLNMLESKTNSCLKNMEDWFTANKLSLNASKTSYIVFSASSIGSTKKYISQFKN